MDNQSEAWSALKLTAMHVGVFYDALKALVVAGGKTMSGLVVVFIGVPAAGILMVMFATLVFCICTNSWVSMINVKSGVTG